ncbi:hypothetical protein GSI_12629 [Ganoderma sinense ZZ0214-1]|uniref:BTB domain-containing protein n=1 Tax=Ganoderma sinense ZZ0214-1 TaxID=1077348 RepID=A0A2G8RTC5_9APHY|nr:hypothetical protein GSI_12629 [Ganoderma sinense ZZ0214-1]
MSALELSTPTRDVPHPFDQRSADIILRTSDSVDFHVHSHILSQVSPVFATMFELPQPAAPPPSSEPKDLAGIHPVTDVTEDSKALEPLLRLCYPDPIPGHDLHDLHDIQPALEAAIKYDMARPTEELAARFLACTPQSPPQVWVFGCRHGLENVARGGAEALRKVLLRGASELLLSPDPMDIPPSSRGLEGISAGQYFRLLQFVCCRGGVRDAATTACDGSNSPSP